jgi:excisionase family DNA binding protein
MSRTTKPRQRLRSAPSNPESNPSNPASDRVWKPEKPLLLSQQQAAALLNISDRTVRNLIKKRKLIPKFIGRRCLIPRVAVEKFARKVSEDNEDNC